MRRFLFIMPDNFLDNRGKRVSSQSFKIVWSVQVWPMMLIPLFVVLMIDSVLIVYSMCFLRSERRRVIVWKRLRLNPWCWFSCVYIFAVEASWVRTSTCRSYGGRSSRMWCAFCCVSGAGSTASSPPCTVLPDPPDLTRQGDLATRPSKVSTPGFTPELFFTCLWDQLSCCKQLDLLRATVIKEQSQCNCCCKALLKSTSKNMVGLS